MPLVSSFSGLIVKAKQTNNQGQRGMKGHGEGIIRKTSLVISSMFHSEPNMWHLAGRGFSTAADVEVSMELFSSLCTLH